MVKAFLEFSIDSWANCSATPGLPSIWGTEEPISSLMASPPSAVLPPVRSKIPTWPDFIRAVKASWNCLGEVLFS